MAPTARGAVLTGQGVRFAVWSGAAERIRVCLFDADGRETDRLELAREGDGLHALHVPGLKEGARYGFRADGPYDPSAGLWFDPDKLLADPHALAIDRPWRHDAALAAPRGEGADTAPLVPKCVVSAPAAVPLATPLLSPGGLIYELQVRSFTHLHRQVPEPLRGTVGALAHPAVIEHLVGLGVDAVELMPVTAWMDERHLPPAGLSNAWGYNPVTFMALDPRLAPGGWKELRETVAALRAAGIGTILDLVFNHTAESDAQGPTLCLRGLDARAYFRHADDGGLVNDTGTGNTIACDHLAARRLILDALRAFVRYAGVDGFRFDLAPILGRDAAGFRADAALLREIGEDPEIGSRVLIAEPWDIGPGGYRLGGFPAPFLEWNDRYRDDIRRFWRGDGSMAGALATRLAGSPDVFSGKRTRSVNFLAAHDGMTLADLVTYEKKHNLANGEDNRDGHDENLSWNHGHEGPSDDAAVTARRKADLRALLATLFVSRGSVMLTAGDEFGRTQGGNNNAYAQDNGITWLDWEGRDRDLEAFAFAASALRRRFASLRDADFLSDGQVEWLGEDGTALEPARWEDASRRRLAMVLREGAARLAVLVNGGEEARFLLPRRQGWRWKLELCSAQPAGVQGDGVTVAARSVAVLVEMEGDGDERQ